MPDEVQGGLPLPSAYRLMTRLPQDQLQQSRKLVYISVANTIKAVNQPGYASGESDFGIGLTFGLPAHDQIDSLLSFVQGIPESAYGDSNPLTHIIDALKLERKTRFVQLGEGFRQAQKRLGEEAVLVAVQAVFGLKNPVDVGWGGGALALVHNADGTGGAAMVSHSGEILHAQHAKPGSTLDIHGQQIDLVGDLGELYDTLTMSEDELDLLS